MQFHDSRSHREILMRIALEQGGLFTADQAIQSGYDQKNHHYYVKTGQWEKVRRSIYRFQPIESELSEYWLWYLWSEGREKKPLAIFSHETSLVLYGLTDLNPSKIHLSVPKKFRKGSEIPKVLVLHKQDIPISDVKTILGLRVTSVLRTLLDLVEEHTISDEFIEQATKEALEKGHISRTDLKKHEKLARYAI